jgi:ubiquinone/menaquinone biosynthesis C-methylase UbiE
MAQYDPEDGFYGGYTPNDGTVEFYGRIKALAKPADTVLDLGAGRAAWYEDDACSFRRQTQTLKGSVRELIAADIDDVVLQNRSSDRNILITEHVPLPDSSIDIIIADYVLEHVEHPVEFVAEIRRLLKPSGLFCARTPHKFSYIAMGARAVSNAKHTRVLRRLQPGRKAQDVFPTMYKMNTLSTLEQQFGGFESASYLFRADPAYYFGNRHLYKGMEVMHRLMPAWFSANIFVFMRNRQL